MRPALTLVELTFVIAILGIVASIGAEIIAQTYESYIVQRAQYRATVKTELALNQIANRLKNALPGTVITRSSITSSGYTFITNVTNPNEQVLQWVGADSDSFEAIGSATNRRPGWSGFCDLDASGPSTIVSPGSNLDLAVSTISNLGGNIGDAVLYFYGTTTGSQPFSVYGISGATGRNFTLDTAIAAGNEISERYKLAWSSYALSVENGDLYLYYNFTPVVGATPGSTRALLLSGVTNFKFRGSEGAIRIKICKEEQIGMSASNTIHACKEKVIF